MNDKTSDTVGLVVPTLGTRPEWLRQTLRSIKSNAADSHTITTVIVGPDNAVTRSVCAEFDIELVVQGGKGLSNAINIGWRSLASRCEYFSWIGDDDLLSPHSIVRTIDALKKNPKASFVYGRTRYIDASGASIYTSRPTRWAPIYLRVGKDFIPQPGSLIRVSSIDWDPLLDETLKNSMDLDLFLKLATRTKSWVYIKCELSAYRLHEQAITRNKGDLDESEFVREQYRSRLSSTAVRLTRVPRMFFEKVVIWIPWKLPNTKKYIEDGAYCIDSTLRVS